MPPFNVTSSLVRGKGSHRPRNPRKFKVTKKQRKKHSGGRPERGDSLSWYRDVVFWVSRFCDLLVSIEIFLTSIQLTGCRVLKEHTRLDPHLNPECQNAESRYQKRDLDTKNETKATSIPQKRHLDAKRRRTHPKVRKK